LLDGHVFATMVHCLSGRTHTYIFMYILIEVCTVTLLACREIMSRSGLTLEKAQEDFEKGLKVEQDFAEYFTGTHMRIYVHTYIHEGVHTGE